MLNKRLFVMLGILVVILSIALSGCKPEVAAEPKTLVVCMGQEPDTLFPYGGAMLAASHIQQAVYDGPIDGRTYAYQPVILEKLPSLDDGDAKIEVVSVSEGDAIVDADGNTAELAAGMMVKPAGCLTADCAVEYTGGSFEMDQMVVEFKLLADLKWSDGSALTADDSVYNFEIGSDPDSTGSQYLPDRTVSYVAADEVTVVWTGVPGYIDSTYFTNFYAPFPRALWQGELGYSVADLLEAEESTRMPMGWGPFVIEEWVAGESITVVKNENYFRADEGLPYVDKVIYRFVDDSNAAVAQLISGECDIVTQDASLDDQSELLIKLEQEGVLNPVFVTGTVWEHVDFAINVVDYDRPDFFEDVRVRQAFAHCLDRQAVVDTILYGRSIVIDSYIPPEHPLYNPDLQQYAYDPAGGMALLEEVGWVDSDGDGVREAAGVEGIEDGTLLEFKWQSTTADMRIQYMQVYQQSLAGCGFKVNLENLPAGEYFADGPDGPVFGRRYDVASFAWLTGVEPACDLYLGLDTNIPSPENNWAGQNNPGFMNAEYDAACLKAIGTLPGSAASKEGHLEAQRIFAEQLPVVPLFLRIKLAATRPEVTGFVMDSTENSEMWNIESFNLVDPTVEE
jgi:peptide/nickel transport system substrate-binding protein